MAGRNGSEVARRRSLGAYYTPRRVADFLVAWADPAGAGRLLDPSFGGCSFLAAAYAHASARGETASVWGVDLDPDAFEHASRLLPSGPNVQLVEADFFTVDTSQLGGRFDSIVGNPPYLRHHHLNGSQIDLARTASARAGVQLPRTADAWAYFVAHSMSLLSEGASMAFVLPGAVLYADYAKVLLQEVSERFGTVSLVRIRERLFDGTREQSVVLAASDYGSPGSSVQRLQVDQACELPAALPAKNSQELSPHVPTAKRLRSLPRVASDAMAKVADAAGSVKLGEVFTVRIGAVTGANKLFLRTAQEAEKLGRDRLAARQVVSRAGDLAGPILDAGDVTKLERAGRRTRLLVFDSLEGLPDLAAEIKTAEADGVHERSHCRRRNPWFALDEPAVPDALLPVMGVRPSPVSLNRAQVGSTNGVHGLYWDAGEGNIDAAVLATWTSHFWLEAELEGRHYGGGVLKLEPSDAKRITLPLVDSGADGLESVNRAFRASGIESAMECADRLVLERGFELSQRETAGIRSEAARLMEYRRGSRSVE